MLASDERGVARILQMSLEGGVWKMWRDAPEFSQRMTGTLSSDGNTMTCQWELSYDGEHWEQNLDVSFVRGIGSYTLRVKLASAIFSKLEPMRMLPSSGREL
jgi:hypothetical protein